MIGRALRTAAWTVGSVLLLGIAAWAVVLAINWRDRAPSEAALRLARAYSERAAVPDEDNAFIYVMGFSVGRREDPHDIGLKRVAWIQQVPFDPGSDPLAERADITRFPRHEAIKAFLEACGPYYSPRCDDAFLASGEVLDQWIDSEPWLLDRYQKLIAHRGWRETVPPDIRAPFPAYALVMDGQRLFLLNVNELARRGDTQAVRGLLAVDLRFWREVLRSSDVLISKMIATVALNRHFKQGSLILGQFPPEKLALAMPAEWAEPISDAERSLSRTIAGEWAFSSSVFREPPDAYFWAGPEHAFDAQVPVSAKVARWVMNPFYQPQDSINSFAAYYCELAANLDAPLRNYTAALDKVGVVQERWQRGTKEWGSPYNVAGKRVMALSGASAFETYAARVNDIEGVRQAALAAITLRAQKVPPQEIAAALEALPLRNPYNDKPFGWDPGDSSIVFVGLAAGERGEHRIRY